MSGWLLGRWLAVRQSGWFSPSRVGNLFPFPEKWQGWAITVALVVALAATVPFHGEIVMLVRLALCIGYIGLGFVTFA